MLFDWSAVSKRVLFEPSEDELDSTPVCEDFRMREAWMFFACRVRCPKCIPYKLDNFMAMIKAPKDLEAHLWEALFSLYEKLEGLEDIDTLRDFENAVLEIGIGQAWVKIKVSYL